MDWIRQIMPQNYGISGGLQILGQTSMIGGAFDHIIFDPNTNQLTLIVNTPQSTSIPITVTPNLAADIIFFKTGGEYVVTDPTSVAFMLESFFQRFKQEGGDKLPIGVDQYTVPHKYPYMAANAGTLIQILADNPK